MALRPVSELGLTDATDVDIPDPTSREVGESRPRRRPSRRSPPRSSAPADKAAAGTPELTAVPAIDPMHVTGVTPPLPTPEPPIKPVRVPLADEPTTFVQIMVPGELQERLADASHALAAEHRKLRHHKTIIGALIWRYVDPDHPESLRELGAALDGYLATDLAEAPAAVKVGAHVPFSLKYRLDGAAIALRRTRRDASAKTLLSALVWRHVNPQDVAALIELLAEYYEVVRPRPFPLAQAAGNA